MTEQERIDALAEALNGTIVWAGPPIVIDRESSAAAVLAALNGWTLVPTGTLEGHRICEENMDDEIAKLRERLRQEVGRKLTDARVEDLMRQEAIPLHGRGISVDLQARGVAAALRALVAYAIVDAALAQPGDEG